MQDLPPAGELFLWPRGIVRRAVSRRRSIRSWSRSAKISYIELVHEDGSVECEGAVKRGVNEKIANELFDEMSSFASYALNKSHAAAYAYVAYQTAWLKCHYPCELMAALLTSVLDSAGKVSGYIAECSRIDIVLPPHVNGEPGGLQSGGRPHPAFRPARRQKSRQGLYQRNFGGAENRWAIYFLLFLL